MTDSEPEIIEVATTRIGPSRRQQGDSGSRRPLSVFLVILIALAIPAVAFIGPRVEQRLQLDLSFLVPTPGPSPTATPRPTPTPPPPTPSPPPKLSIGDGELPAAIAIDTGGIRRVDPETGRLGPPGAIRADNDAVFRAPNGGWWCVCFGRNQDDNHETVEVVVRYLDSNAVERSSSAIATTESVPDPPDQDFWTRVDAELSPDGGTAFVAMAVRGPGGWTISIDAIDLSLGTSIGRNDIAFVAVTPPTVEEANQGYGTYLGGPLIRLSPRGDRLLVAHWLEKNTSTMSERQAMSVSVIDVAAASRGAGPPGAATDLGGAITEAIPTCYWIQWLTDESILAACWREEVANGEAPIELTTFGLDGSRLSGIDYVPDPENWTADPVLDVANRRIYLWSPMSHRFDAIDIDSGRQESLTVAPESSRDTPDGPIGSASAWPSWATMYSDYTPWAIPQLLPDSRGTRLFAVGALMGREDPERGQTNGSSGIWVFDTNTLELVDHWPAAAAYSGLGLSRDGRWVYAMGQGGADEQGNPSGWPPSVSIHDAADGRLAIQLADFVTDQPLLPAP